MVCGSLNEIDQGGGGDTQPLDGSAMAPRRHYHNEKLGIVHGLIHSRQICTSRLVDLPRQHRIHDGSSIVRTPKSDID